MGPSLASSSIPVRPRAAPVPHVSLRASLSAVVLWVAGAAVHTTVR